jgi:hypothetical protein
VDRYPTRVRSSSSWGILTLEPMRLAPLLVLLATGLGWAADTASAPQAIAERGMTAMKDSFQRPAAIIDAAMSFSEARRLYQDQSDIEHVCEMQAYLFWCKRRMNLDELRSFVGQKDEARLSKAVSLVDEVAAKPVPSGEAQAYFDRARSYADQHPANHLEIAMRYFEVAERFQGSELSLKAQRISLDEQQRHLASLKDAPPVAATPAPAPATPVTAPAPAVDTLFSRRVAAVDGERAAVPSAEALRASTTQIRQTYKLDYARPGKSPHRILAARLLAQARATRDDVAMRWALLVESREQAVAAADPQAACAAIDAAAELFSGVDAPALKKSALTHVGTAPATAMARLIDTPANAEANTTVGRWFCFQLGRWDDGVRLLANGADRELKRVAEQELAAGSDAQRMSDVADAWFKLAGKEKGEVQLALMQRCATWCARCAPLLSGMSQEVAAKRLDEINASLPDDHLDYATISQKRWQTIKAKPFRALGDKDRLDTGVVLAPGQIARIAVNPANAKWRVVPEWCDAHGKAGTLVNGLNAGEMLWSIDQGPRQSIWAGPIVGEGHLMLGANRPKDGGKGDDIELKIVVSTDDD